MIRFIDLTDKIIEGEQMFAWYDTVRDNFLEFCGIQTWDSWEVFLADYNGDEVERFKRLIPNWFTKSNS